MGLSSLMISSVLLMIAMGLNQAECEPRLYWDMVFPNTPKPSAIEKLLPQAVVMKPAASRSVADRKVNFGRKGARDNSVPNYNGKSIEETKSNHPSASSALIFGYQNYGASKMPDASENVVGDGVNSIEGTESNHPSAIPAQIFPYLDYGANEKPNASRNVVNDGVSSIEGTESNHPSAIPAQIFPYLNYGANEKPNASRNVVNDRVNSIEGTESNHPSAIPAQIFPYLNYGANEKPNASRNVVNDGVNSIEGTESNHPSAIPAQIFPYLKYGANEKPSASRNVVNDGVNFDRRGVEANTDPNFDPSIAIFFHREELYPGKRFALLLVSVDGRSAKFIPRQEANTIPFSTSEFPSILSRNSISPGSDMATKMRDTLQLCEMSSVAGEVAQCATSLEAMVEFATTKLGTHDVVAMTMEGGDAYAAKRRSYKVKAMRRVVEAGGKRAVTCHPQPYPYVVFFCHSVITIEVYSVDLILENDGATMVKVVAVCHLDTSKWNPKHISFKALGVEPGKGAVCHFLPLGHIVWATK